MKIFRFKEDKWRGDNEIIRVSSNYSMGLIELDISSKQFSLKYNEKYTAYHNGESKPHIGENVIDIDGKWYKDAILVQSASTNINEALARKKWGRNKPQVCKFADGVITVSKGFEGQIIGKQGRIIKAISKVWGNKVEVKGV